jgi:hypothetical protein
MGKRLLTQNSELRPDGIFNWSLPAFGVTLTNGKTMNVCPNAGACASYCYARNGTYNFSNVKARHIWNLELILDDIVSWKTLMLEEVQHPKMKGKHIRIHDSGDFFSDDYLLAWLDIATKTPEVNFYCYTKEVSRFKRLVQPNCPSNFRYLYSLGGKEDHLVDLEKDRHADVFPDDAAILDAGYMNQEASDLLAITLPTNKIGIPANNIKHFNKKMKRRTFSELQRERDVVKERKLGRVSSSSN